MDFIIQMFFYTLVVEMDVLGLRLRASTSTPSCQNYLQTLIIHNGFTQLVLLT